MQQAGGLDRSSYRYCTWNSVHDRAEARLPTGLHSGTRDGLETVVQELAKKPTLVLQRHMVRDGQDRGPQRATDRRTASWSIRGAAGGQSKRETASEGPESRVVFWQERTPACSEKPRKAGCASSTGQLATGKSSPFVPRQSFPVSRHLTRPLARWTSIFWQPLISL